MGGSLRRQVSGTEGLYSCLIPEMQACIAKNEKAGREPGFLLIEDRSELHTDTELDAVVAVLDLADTVVEGL